MDQIYCWKCGRSFDFYLDRCPPVDGFLAVNKWEKRKTKSCLCLFAVLKLTHKNRGGYHNSTRFAGAAWYSGKASG